LRIDISCSSKLKITPSLNPSDFLCTTIGVAYTGKRSTKLVLQFPEAVVTITFARPASSTAACKRKSHYTRPSPFPHQVNSITTTSIPKILLPSPRNAPHITNSSQASSPSPHENPANSSSHRLTTTHTTNQHTHTQISPTSTRFPPHIVRKQDRKKKKTHQQKHPPTPPRSNPTPSTHPHATPPPSPNNSASPPLPHPLSPAPWRGWSAPRSRIGAGEGRV